MGDSLLCSLTEILDLFFDFLSYSWYQSLFQPAWVVLEVEIEFLNWLGVAGAEIVLQRYCLTRDPRIWNWDLEAAARGFKLGFERSCIKGCVLVFLIEVCCAGGAQLSSWGSG